MQIKKTGTLYVVATPIGNLKDITLRAIEVLKSVDKIAAEDTRHVSSLLNHFSIQKPTISLHDFNERERINSIIEELQSGKSIALVSDAGTPLISDPGFHLVKAAKLAKCEVVPIPGACAAIAALSVSALPVDKFVFEGFLTHKAKARDERLAFLAQETRTLIFYEAPHRLLSTLESMCSAFGPKREACVARELTKIYESVLRDTLQNLVDYFASHPDELRGELVILIAGAKEKEKSSQIEITSTAVLDLLLSELSLKQAVSLTAKMTGERKNEIYKLALQKTETGEKGKTRSKPKKRSTLL